MSSRTTRWNLLFALLVAAVASADERLLVGGVVHGAGVPAPATLHLRDGRIVGMLAPGERPPSATVEEVELAGAHVLPGLIDAHLHVAGYGAALEQVDLVGARSWEEAVRRTAEAARGRAAGEWIEGRGWDQNLWPGAEFPDRELLDRVLPGRPVMLRRVDGHAAVVSGAALAAAGITGDTPDPPGGRIVRDRDGQPTGVLVDTALELVRRVMPRPDAAAVERRIVGSLEALARVGLTQVHDAGTTATELAAMRRLDAAGRLPVRVYVLLDGGDDRLVAEEVARGPSRGGPAMLRVGGVKLYADGALGSRGALLGQEYADDPGNRGLAVSSEEELRARVLRAAEGGFQVAVHAIGDEAVHRTLDAFAAVDDGHRAPLRHRVEHSQIVRPGDVERYSRLGVIASVQPTHCTSDMPWAGARLGLDRLPWAYRWRSFLDGGVALAGGSDAPVEDPDPRLGLWAALTRQRPDGTPAGGWNPGERLRPEEALRLFAGWAAYAGHAEGWSGAIRPGAAADLTIMAGDPFAGGPERVLQVSVLRTVVGGRDAWVAPAAAAAGGES